MDLYSTSTLPNPPNRMVEKSLFKLQPNGCGSTKIWSQSSAVTKFWLAISQEIFIVESKVFVFWEQHAHHHGMTLTYVKDKSEFDLLTFKFEKNAEITQLAYLGQF